MSRNAAVPEHRTTGAVFTRPEVVEYMLREVRRAGKFRKWSSLRILEPSCGDGAFVLPIIDALIAERPDWNDRSLNGFLSSFDVSEQSIARVRAAAAVRLKEAGCPRTVIARLLAHWFFCEDFLLREFSERFDVVIGNPPYINGPERGRDIQQEVRLTFREAYEGVDKEIDVQKTIHCNKCHGSGAEPGTNVSTCSECGGSGVVIKTMRTPFGNIGSQTTCPRCRGKGKVVERPCSACSGKGKVRSTKKVSVTIPAGVDTGSMMRVPGEGDAGDAGAASGDLYVVVNVSGMAGFDRRGDDIYSTVTVEFPQAVLGAAIPVKTMTGESTLNLPAGTQSHTTFRMKGKGFPHLNTKGNGDQYVKVIIRTPEKLTAEQKELMQKYAETLGMKKEGATGSAESSGEKTGKDGKKKKEKGFFEKIFGDESD